MRTKALSKRVAQVSHRDQLDETRTLGYAFGGGTSLMDRNEFGWPKFRQKRGAFPFYEILATPSGLPTSCPAAIAASGQDG
jgi:hypothetical protein